MEIINSNEIGEKAFFIQLKAKGCVFIVKEEPDGLYISKVHSDKKEENITIHPKASNAITIS